MVLMLNFSLYPYPLPCNFTFFSIVDWLSQSFNLETEVWIRLWTGACSLTLLWQYAQIILLEEERTDLSYFRCSSWGHERSDEDFKYLLSSETVYFRLLNQPILSSFLVLPLPSLCPWASCSTFLINKWVS